MRLERAVAVVAASVLLAGCGSSGKPLHVSADKESAWVSSLQDWLAVESFQGNFRGCAARLAAKVGESPARDLEPVDTAVSRLCDGFERAYHDLDRAFKTSDAGLYARSQREMRRAEAQIAPVRALVDAWHPGASGGGLPTRGGLVESSRIEPRFSEAASEVAHTRVTVRCWSAADWPRIERVARAEGSALIDLAGLADPTTGTADLSPEVCRDLVGIAYGNARTGANAAFGLTVLAHEATHLREDSGTEAVTECFAMQRDVEAAAKLGLTDAEARSLARLYWTDIYPENLPEYSTPDCRNGGPYDLHPHDSRWP